MSYYYLSCSILYICNLSIGLSVGLLLGCSLIIASGESRVPIELVIIPGQSSDFLPTSCPDKQTKFGRPNLLYIINWEVMEFTKEN